MLTGFALVHSFMESARDRDDSLDEIHAALRASHHRWLTILAWLTGLAIVLSLVVVYCNRPSEPVPGWALVLVASLDLAAVIGGLAFVVAIVDPRKYQKAAERVLEQKPVAVSGPAAPATEFFEAFRHLERLIRDYLRERDLYVPSRGAPRMSYSFRQMIEALFQNEKIDRPLFAELLELSKYRNLVFHGHVEQADSAMVERVRSAITRVEHLE